MTRIITELKLIMTLIFLMCLSLKPLIEGFLKGKNTFHKDSEIKKPAIFIGVKALFK